MSKEIRKNKIILDIESEEEITEKDRPQKRQAEASKSVYIKRKRSEERRGKRKEEKKSQAQSKKRETADCKPYRTEITEQGIFLQLLPRHPNYLLTLFLSRLTEKVGCVTRPF